MYKYNRDLYISSSENISVTEYLGREIPYTTHTHEFIEIVYILKGEVMHRIDDKYFLMKEGDMIFVNYHQMHAFSSLAL